MENTEAWDRVARREPGDAGAPTDAVAYGTGLPNEGELKLLGNPAGRRVLELGCGTGQAAIALARQGASVIAVDGSAEQLAVARRRADRAKVRIEWHRSDLADLAFLSADSIDLALSIDTLGEVDDLSRLFRQTQRVLRPNAPFVFSHAHPLALVTAQDRPGPGTVPPAAGPVTVDRSLFDRSPLTVDRGGEPITVFSRTLADELTALHRAGFRVDTLLEPESADDVRSMVPTGVIWRAKKQGV